MLLGPAQIRALAAELDLNPTKRLGQNFVHDGATVRKIVRLADVAGQHVLEIGPGLGSLTLGLAEVAASITAIEIDPRLAERLPQTMAEYAPDAAVRVIEADALAVTALPGPQPSALVANLPYNVAVPVLLTALASFPTLDRALVMVQAEVADRIAAAPGSRIYGAPSAKVAWYAAATRAATIARTVFWPVPNVDSALVALTARPAPQTSATREQVFAVIDAAFSMRRKTMRSCLAGLAGSPAAAETVLRGVGIDPQIRGEQLDITDFAAIAGALS